MSTWSTMMNTRSGRLFGWYLILNVPDLTSSEAVREAVMRSGFVEPSWGDEVGPLLIEPLDICFDCAPKLPHISFNDLVEGNTGPLARQLKGIRFTKTMRHHRTAQ